MHGLSFFESAPACLLPVAPAIASAATAVRAAHTISQPPSSTQTPQHISKPPAAPSATGSRVQKHETKSRAKQKGHHPTNQPHSTTCFALRDTTNATGNNIVSVLLLRDATAPDDWASYSWQTQDQWHAIEYVKQQNSLDNTFDDNWSTIDAPPATPITAPESPLLSTAGVLNSDPLQLVLQLSTDPDSLLDVLVNVGYAASNLPINNGAGDCTSGNILDALAAGVDAYAASDPSLSSADRLNIAYELKYNVLQTCGVGGIFDYCIPVIGCASAWGPSSAWTPGPWVLVGATRSFPLIPTSPILTCNYERDNTRTRSRICTIRHLDCTTTSCTAIQTDTWTELLSCANTSGWTMCPPTPPAICVATWATGPAPPATASIIKSCTDNCPFPWDGCP